jgi:hypothetical protein
MDLRLQEAVRARRVGSFEATVTAGHSRGSYRTGHAPDVLERAAAPDVQIAVWRRQLPAEHCSALARWASDAAPHYDEVVEAASWGPELAVNGALAASARAWLQADVADLLARFCEIAGSLRVRVALKAVTTDACRKFHADSLPMRMITTYVGPGTEWLPSYAVSRDVLAEPPECPSEANRAIVRDCRAIRRARAGDVLLMKGERHPHGPGCVHRSPPISAAGLTRLVLTLTTA